MNRCGTHLGYRDHQHADEPTCQPCRDAQATWQREYEVRRLMAGAHYIHRSMPLDGGHMLVDATGTRRRLQALAVMGWRTTDLAERLGTSRRYISDQVCRNRSFVRRSTAEKVAALYDELSMLHGPSRRVSSDSLRKGWAPPLAFDEEDLDDPAARPAHDIQGHERGKPRDLDLEERVLVLTRAGLSAAEIAVRLRTNKRYVQRVRARARQEDVA